MSDGNEKLYDFKSRSDVTAVLCLDASRTVQADAADADINTIVRRFGLTGTLPESFRVPLLEDYSEVGDFHSAQLAIAEAHANFMLIPADVRAKFSNDPGIFLDFAVNPDNIDTLRELGLAKPKSVEIQSVPEVNDGKTV